MNDCKDQELLGQDSYEHTFKVVPCPLCKTTKWIGMETFIGRDKCGIDMFFCAACGLCSEPTSTRIYAADLWNRLSRRIRSGNPKHP